MMEPQEDLVAALLVQREIPVVLVKILLKLVKMLKLLKVSLKLVKILLMAALQWAQEEIPVTLGLEAMEIPFLHQPQLMGPQVKLEIQVKDLLSFFPKKATLVLMAAWRKTRYRTTSVFQTNPSCLELSVAAVAV
jgi:hypothetical protein